jgi:hypothetical protein
MPADAGIHLVDSGFRRNDEASVGALDPVVNKKTFLIAKCDSKGLVYILPALPNIIV